MRFGPRFRSILMILLCVAAGSLVVHAMSNLTAEERQAYEEAKAGLNSLKPEPLYSFPWPAGEKHSVLQGWFGTVTHDKQKAWYAWDFTFTPQQEVSAARAGVVHEVNSGQGEMANYLVVRHEDKTLAAYGHLRDDGFRVKKGDRVNEGDLIGFCGPEEKHLHFVIWTMGNPRKGLPSAFREHPNHNGIPRQGEMCTSTNIRVDEAAIASCGQICDKAEEYFEKGKPAHALATLDPAIAMARKGVKDPVFDRVDELVRKITGERDEVFSRAEEAVTNGDYTGTEDALKDLKRAWGSSSETGRKASQLWREISRSKAYKAWKKENK